MERMAVFAQYIDDPEEFAKLIDIAVQDMYNDNIPSIAALADYLMSDEDECPA